VLPTGRSDTTNGACAGDASTKAKILETVESLTLLLDVPEHWDVVLYDPSGVSEISPDADVAIERYDPDAE
jgi:hypothetical protein